VEEVHELADRVGLGLCHRLGLVEHRRGHEPLSVRAGRERGSAQEHGRPFGPAPAMPVLPGGARGVDRRLHVGGRRLVHVREHHRVVVRHDGLGQRAGAPLAAADDERQVAARRGQLVQRRVELHPLRRSGAVAERRLERGRRERRQRARGRRRSREATDRLVDPRLLV
jgi:hypothetical protein